MEASMHGDGLLSVGLKGTIAFFKGAQQVNVGHQGVMI
jgi:hypothetical protein